MELWKCLFHGYMGMDGYNEILACTLLGMEFGITEECRQCTLMRVGPTIVKNTMCSSGPPH